MDFAKSFCQLSLLVSAVDSVAGILVVAIVTVAVVVTNHIEVGQTQPHKHVDTGNTHKNIQQSFQPSQAKGNPVNKVKTENTNRKPVECADDC